MRAVIQRVTRARVKVDGEVVGEIGNGLVVLLGIARDDTHADADYLADKTAALRIFDDGEGKMNLSVKESDGALLVISQFTLHGDVRRGLRPSWIEAAAPEFAELLYDYFVARCRTNVCTSPRNACEATQRRMPIARQAITGVGLHSTIAL